MPRKEHQQILIEDIIMISMINNNNDDNNSNNDNINISSDKNNTYNDKNNKYYNYRYYIIITIPTKMVEIINENNGDDLFKFSLFQRELALFQNAS